MSIVGEVQRGVADVGSPHPVPEICKRLVEGLDPHHAQTRKFEVEDDVVKIMMLK